ncbi:MAG: DUF5915 domain-containing protein [Bryobacterales bacterium]
MLNDAALQQRLTPYLDLISEGSRQTVLTVRRGARAVRPANFRRLAASQRSPPPCKPTRQPLRAELLEKAPPPSRSKGKRSPSTPRDVEVLVEAEGGYAAAGDTTTVVALDTEIDQQLLDEGLYREILRRVQDLRRTSTSNTPSASRFASAVQTAWRTCSPRTVTNLAAEALIGDLRIGGPCLDTCEVRELGRQRDRPHRAGPVGAMKRTMKLDRPTGTGRRSSL